MNLPRFVFRVVLAALFLVPVAAVTTHAQDQDKQQDQNSDQAKQQKNPFAPEPAPPLPPGMTGSKHHRPALQALPRHVQRRRNRDGHEASRFREEV